MYIAIGRGLVNTGVACLEENLYNNYICIFFGFCTQRVFRRRINVGERLVSICYDGCGVDLPFRVTVVCPSEISAPYVATDTEILGSEMQKSYAARDIVPCPVYREQRVTAELQVAVRSAGNVETALQTI